MGLASFQRVTSSSHFMDRTSRSCVNTAYTMQTVRLASRNTEGWRSSGESSVDMSVKDSLTMGSRRKGRNIPRLHMRGQ